MEERLFDWKGDGLFHWRKGFELPEGGENPKERIGSLVEDSLLGSSG